MRSMVGRRPGRGRGRRGFTLLELMVVLVILALAVGLTPPLFRAAVPSARLKAAAQDLAGSLRLVRNLAVSRGEAAQLALDPESRTYRFAAARRPRTLPAGVEVRAEPASRRSSDPAPLVFTFFADGSSLGGAARLSAGKQAYLVEVDPVRGSVSIRPAG